MKSKIMFTIVIIAWVFICYNIYSINAETDRNLVISEKAVTKSCYKNVLANYCFKNDIRLDYDKIDSAYMVLEPEVQNYIYKVTGKK